MLAPIEWLKDFVTLPSDIKELCHKLTLSGSKVETYYEFGQDLDKIVTGQIIKIEKHENADKLLVCQINIGRDQLLQIVTGAQNVAEGQIVPVALNGSTVFGGHKIKTGQLRGVTSEGMLCSLAELGLSTDLFEEAIEDGIFVLPSNLPLGLDIIKALELEGGVIEFEITSNRPDCFSIIGLAREVALTYQQKFDLPGLQLQLNPNVSTQNNLKVEVLNSEACPRYMARRIENVKIMPSPLWLKRRLLMAGVRPINSIVDITNYVMLEYGQPMHAFKAETIKDNKIIIRKANAGEKIKTLDAKEYTLQPNDLLIADSEKPLALAGIMGGENSQIDADTTTVIFEVANFDADVVRETAARLAIRTESSSRFERCLDYNICQMALDRACSLVNELNCGDVAEDYIDVNNGIDKRGAIQLNLNKLNRFLGLNLGMDYVKNLLIDLGSTIIRETPEALEVLPASFRPDLEGFADLAEEVARFNDYNKIPDTLLATAETTIGGRSFKMNVAQKVSAILRSLGFYEAYTYSFASPKEFDRLGLKPESSLRNTVKIRRAAEDSSILRTTVLPSLLTMAATNFSRFEPEARLFEIMRTYHPQSEAKLPLEKDVISAILYTQGMASDDGELFFELKNAVNEFVETLGIKSLKYHVAYVDEFYQKSASDETACFHPYRLALISIRNQVVGMIGYLHPQVLANYNLPHNTAALILDLQPVVDAASLVRKQQPLPKYPSTSRDLAILVDRDIPVAKIETILQKQGGKLLENIELFDVYQGERIAADKKSVAYKLIFRSNSQTLQDKDINPLIEAIVLQLQKDLGAELRS